jgi:hypothetical protein
MTPNLELLRSVERKAIGLAVLVSVGSLLSFRLDVILGALAGASLAAGNMASIRRLTELLPRFAERGRSVVVGLLAAKLGLLALLVFLLMKYLPMSVGAFLVGLSVPLLAIVLAVSSAKRDAAV